MKKIWLILVVLATVLLSSCSVLTSSSSAKQVITITLYHYDGSTETYSNVNRVSYTTPRVSFYTEDGICISTTLLFKVTYENPKRTTYKGD